MLTENLNIHRTHAPTKGRCEMKGRLIALVCIFCMAILMVSGQDSRGKPDKPGKPDKSNPEWIAFHGGLVGGQEVEGCCPNAGPFPYYTMPLNHDVSEDFPAGTYDGQLFINGYGTGRPQDRQYIVQFWKKETDIAIEIIGGVVEFDKRSRILIYASKTPNLICSLPAAHRRQNSSLAF